MDKHYIRLELEDYQALVAGKEITKESSRSVRSVVRPSGHVEVHLVLADIGFVEMASAIHAAMEKRNA